MTKHHDFSKHLFFLQSNTVVANQPSGSCRGVNSKHHAAERWDLKFGFQTQLKNVKTHWKVWKLTEKFFSGVWAKFQIPPLRSVMFAIKQLLSFWRCVNHSQNSNILEHLSDLILFAASLRTQKSKVSKVLWMTEQQQCYSNNWNSLFCC